MPYPYIAQADLESRLSADVVRRLLDDDRDGSADATPVARVIADASAKVAGYLRGVYSLAAIETTTPEEVKRLTLDVACAYLAQRHPEVLRLDWAEAMKLVDRELKDLRNGVSRLDVEDAPEPAANQGGSTSSGNPACPEPAPRFSDNWGDF
jgi:phage gp36-like protein